MIKKKIKIIRNNDTARVHVELPIEFIRLLDGICEESNRANPELEQATSEDIISMSISDVLDGIMMEIADIPVSTVIEGNETIH